MSGIFVFVSSLALASVFAHGEAAVKDCGRGLIGGREELAKCVRSKHHDVDDMISTKKNEYMKKFKCCFKSLRLCIENVNTKKTKGVDQQTCSLRMIMCVKGNKTMDDFRKDSPPKLRKMFRHYGVCQLKKRIDLCVREYFTRMEILIGMDCLNKYIHCVYAWKDNGVKNDEGKKVKGDKKAKRDKKIKGDKKLKGDKRSKGDVCHGQWKQCMAPACSPATSTSYNTKLISGIWACNEEKVPADREDRHVFKTLKCILDMYKRGTVMSPLLSREHVREACYLVYGGNNFTAKTVFEACVENNGKKSYV